MKKEKRIRHFLITTIVLLTILSAALLIAVILQATSKTKESDVCVTKECTVAAASLISSMDETQDPCTDFYSYVCGDYIHKTSELYDHFVERKKLLKLQVRELMELPNSPNDPSAVLKARLAYKICLNTTRFEELGITPLKIFVQELGGWPIAVGTNWSPQPNSFIEDILGKLESIGYPGKVFKLLVAPDPTNPDVKIITLDQPNDDSDNFDVTRKKREDKDKDQETRMELIEVTARVIGNNNNTEQITTEVKEMIKLTDDLKNILSPAESRKNQTRLYNKMTIKQLHEITNHTFNWLSFLQIIFGTEIVNENVSINVMEVGYMKKMPLIFEKYGRRTVTNFALWNVISDVFGYVTDKAYSQESLKPTIRWQSCLQDISDSLPFAMWRIFADHVLPNETIQYAQELTSNLHQTYRETIENSEWLDLKTKDNALKKLNAMIKLVGYPEWVSDNTQLNEYYKEYDITTNHFNNMVTATRKSVQKVIREMHKPVDRNEWPDGIGVLTANAFYVIASNTIYIPGGMLQPPFYSPNRSQAMNYGSLGSIIGHEIGHAFDDEGSQMDERGALHEWWTKVSLEVYTKRSQCFKYQYNAYCFNDTQLEAGINDTCVNGGLTLGENVPDNTGIQCAFSAYKRWVKSHHEEKPLVGLKELKPEQLFFISYAYTWCENITPKQWFTYFGEDPHSPGRYRVQGPLSNYRAFTETFQCNLGPMNRGDSSCSLW
uniref:Peptidase M13 N-terminal domain-containing protein n=1 Tax=Strigamia maritima TaxID=126957 RepID=T1JLU6_STRMM